VRLQVVVDEAASKHLGGSRNRGIAGLRAVGRDGRPNRNGPRLEIGDEQVARQRPESSPAFVRAGVPRLRPSPRCSYSPRGCESRADALCATRVGASAMLIGRSRPAAAGVRGWIAIRTGSGSHGDAQSAHRRDCRRPRRQTRPNTEAGADDDDCSRGGIPIVRRSSCPRLPGHRSAPATRSGQSQRSDHRTATAVWSGGTNPRCRRSNLLDVQLRPTPRSARLPVIGAPAQR
jgi:hypothetical protein